MNPIAADAGRPLSHEERRVRNALARSRSFARVGSEEYELGFHGDAYLLDLADVVLHWAENFIETGANLGNTAIYAARRRPALRVHSCEPGAAAFAVASRRAAAFPNAQIREATSPEFLHDLFHERPEIAQQRNFFFLDAHGYGFDWPLGDEIEFITTRLDRAAVLIDDLLVPGRPWFGFDEYNGQMCSLEALRPRFATGREYRVIYPTYQDRTSPHHGLRGYGLVCFGDAAAAAPPAHAARFEHTAFRT